MSGAGLTGWRVTNRARGEVTLDLDGKAVPLRLTLQALAEIETAFGAKDLTALIEKLADGRPTTRELLAIVVATSRNAAHSSLDLARLHDLSAADTGIVIGAIGELITVTFASTKAETTHPDELSRTER